MIKNNYAKEGKCVVCFKIETLTYWIWSTVRTNYMVAEDAVFVVPNTWLFSSNDGVSTIIHHYFPKSKDSFYFYHQPPMFFYWDKGPDIECKGATIDLGWRNKHICKLTHSYGGCICPDEMVLTSL